MGYVHIQVLRGAITLAACAASVLVGAQTAFYQHDFNGEHREDYGQRVLVDREGNKYVSGTRTSASSGKDMFLLRYRPGDTTPYLEYSYDGPGHGDDILSGMVLDKDGNIYLCGTSAGSGTGLDAAVIKLNKSLQIVWPTSGGHFTNGAARYNISNQNDTATGIAYAVPNSGDPHLLVCGWTAGTNESGWVWDLDLDGADRSGWPQLYSISGQDVRFNAVDADPVSPNRVWAAGYRTTSNNHGTDTLVVRWPGSGGSSPVAYSNNYENGDDQASDIVFTKNNTVAVCGSVTKSSDGNRRFAMYKIGESPTNPLVWSQVVTGSVSWANAITYSDGFVYATGHTEDSGGSFLTVKLEWEDGDFSTTWASSTEEATGTREFAAHNSPGDVGGDFSPSAEAWAIKLAGTNVYVTGQGYGDHGGDPPPQPHLHYVTVAYTSPVGSSGGSLRGEFFPTYSIYPPEDQPHGVDIGFGLDVFCAGELYVAGRYYDEPHLNYDSGTLLYQQTNHEAEPGSNFTINVGTRNDSNTDPLDDSDDSYLDITHGTDPATFQPAVTVEVKANVGSDYVSELCFELESQSATGILQTVQLYNYEAAQWETFDSRMATTTDRTLHISIPGDPTPYIKQDTTNGAIGDVKARLKYTVTASVIGNWGVKIDLASWKYLNDD